MTEQELYDSRRRLWRLDGRPVRTLEEASEFIESVGFCLMYPLPGHAGGIEASAGGATALLIPTFIGAWTGSGENLPTWQRAYADPRAREASELMVRLLRQKAAFEANLFGETSFLVAASLFPYFYALVGDRNPRQTPQPGKRSEYSPLARDLFEAIRKQGPVSKQRLAQILGGSLSVSALDRALGELWSRLRITRVDYRAGEGAFWDALYRWAPEPVREGINLSVGEALSGALSRYLEAVVAAEASEVEAFFSHFVPRSRIRESLNALLGAREFAFLPLGKRNLIQVTPPRATPDRPRVPRPRQVNEK